MPDLEYNVKPVSQLREEIEQAARAWKLAEDTRFEPTEVAGVSCEWIVAPDSRGQEPPSDAPVYLHAHGGGYYRGSARVDAAICSHLCAQTGMRCLSVNYRRPPDEGVFPAAVDDVTVVTRSLWRTGFAEPRSTIVGGTSAGGGLCLALLLRLRDESAPLPAGAIAVSPWTDLTQSGESFATNAATGPDKSYLDHWAGVYLDGADPRHPYASPLHGELRGMPPLLIQVGGAETMLDDATAFAAKAARSGAAVTLEVYTGQPHSFQHDVGVKPVATEAVDGMARFARHCLDRPVI